MVRLVVITTNGDAVILSRRNLANRDWGLGDVDRFLLWEHMAGDVLEVLTEVSGARHRLEFTITRPDHAWQRVIESILELALPENVLSARGMLRHLHWHVK